VRIPRASDLHKNGRNCGWIRVSRRFPFPDTYRVRAPGDGAPIRDVLNKIRIEMGFGSLVKHHRKRPADRTRILLFAKLRSGWLPAAKCVLFVQHSPEKDQSRR
jgi:hypothetical protein